MINYEKQGKEDQRDFHTTPSKASKFTSSTNNLEQKIMYNISSMSQDESGLKMARNGKSPIACKMTRRTKKSVQIL